MRLTGMVALVTGASSGIGAATATALAAAGARVLLAGRDQARLAGVAARTGGLVLAADLAAAGGAAALAAAAFQAAPEGIVILVSNAGLGWSGPMSEMPAEKVCELLTVNLAAPIQLARLLMPGMIKRGRGRMVFVSSIAGVTGVAREAVYAATKAGLGTFAESLSYETRRNGIGVSLIVPGVIDTPFFQRRGRPYARRLPAPIPPERVARAVVHAVQRDRDMVYVPRWMRIPAMLHGTVPWVFRAMAERFGDPG
jgi:short-subunit dehydrogenase